MRRFRQRKLPELILCGYFPERYDTQIRHVAIFDRLTNRGLDSRIPRDVPEEDVRIEQQPHCSKSRSTSSGNGSSKSSGTTKLPAARPNGRGLRTAAIGRISATGRSSSVTTSVSP